MKKSLFNFLENENEDLYNLAKDMENSIYSDPHTAIIKGRIFAEKLSKIISDTEGCSELNNLTQVERIRELKNHGIIDIEIDLILHRIRTLGNKAAHDIVEDDLESAISMHRNLYKLACWYMESYIDYEFKAEKYEVPMPEVKENNSEAIDNLMNQVKDLINITKESSKTEENKEEKTSEETVIEKKEESKKEVKVSKEKSKECLIQELSKLKQSSKEAVEGLNEFSEFKTYMHITRNVQNELEVLIKEANKKSNAQLILICGSVGDGKSHVISYFKNKYPDIMSNFTLHNDATESLEPNKTSMDTLNDVLDSFCDEKIDTSTEKFILAINLGTLNNFIDSEYGSRFSKLKQYVLDKNILESTIEDNKFDENSNIQFINFSDYHIYTLKDGKVQSDYVKSLIKKVTDPSEMNIFYKAYKENCTGCKNSTCCPIKANYELISKDEVQEGIVQLLVQCIIKNKVIISTRALLNFIYELIISRTYVDVNSPTFKNKIAKLDNISYIKALTPNIIFEHKELSFIFEALNTLDPLNVRNSKVDDFIVEFNNSEDIMKFFKDYIDYPKGYIEKVADINFNETSDKKIRLELLKLFIRSYYLCGMGEIFSLKDNRYDEFIRNVYYWNKGDKSKLKKLYGDIKDGVMKWNGEAEKGYMNIFVAKNQIKYKVSEEIELKADVSNIPKNDEAELVKFLTTLKIKYKKEGTNDSNEIDLDYGLYDLLQKVINGYRPNKKDKNQFIKFIEFINRTEEMGSRDEKLVFTEKNKDTNKKYKLEYNDEFEEYRFVEI
ncbi:MAG: DNA phosphorothioation-dependent restriction protein DptF [Clostridium sp.]|uniref:DNA phosphorothioation-dependent restriction protein DptF n=1 Tax=Clostridium sp. TaxID=1506 RepID=UPI001DA99AC1|nr:DNA phosphorothioation-dependent restriction protein DptF [Clostridium sp.]MBS5126220.1 DNA phosphorothioation-dependent restriction protein DptF [Clostridium sp.]